MPRSPPGTPCSAGRSSRIALPSISVARTGPDTRQARPGRRWRDWCHDLSLDSEARPPGGRASLHAAPRADSITEIKRRRLTWSYASLAPNRRTDPGGDAP